VKSGGLTAEGAPSTLEPVHRYRQFLDGGDAARAVQNDHVSGVADGNAVVFHPHNPGRAMGDHVQALAKTLLRSNLSNVGVQVGHTDHRAITERREGIEYVVGGQGTVHAVFDQPVHGCDTADDVVVSICPHEVQVRGR